ncbi:hypothetical protein AB0P36_36010 [Streptomyces flavidovirens]|uniref:hypothetical protein n=1 Tax=Streptomyces flavidovirens TaxID=67298 RepID=UPI00342623B1
MPAQHRDDGGCISTAMPNGSTLNHQLQPVGPVKASGAWQEKEQAGLTRDDFTIGFDRRQVTCPHGHTGKTRIEAAATAPAQPPASPPVSATHVQTGPPAHEESPPAP